MEDYRIIYSERFENSLTEKISDWETKLFLSEDKIKRYVRIIYKSLEILRIFPDMHEDVAHLYGFRKPTYRILIGKSLAIFYRVDRKNRMILVGNIYNLKQMHLEF